MFTCTICTDDRDDSDKRTTPCCDTDICAQCITESTEAVVRYQRDRYVCSLCHTAVADPDDYEDIVPARTVTAMRAALNALAPAPAAPAANAATVVTVPDATLKENAWQFGAYTHSPGCGSAVSIIEGCDTLNCPTCGVQINIAGGQPGMHTYDVEAFFGEVRKFTGKTSADQLAILQKNYPTVWESRFLTELTDGIRDGSLVDWIGSMADYVWGDFRDFLTQRIAPRPPGPDESSLFALIASIDEKSTDGQLLSAHYHAVEKPGKLTELDTLQARRKVAGQVSTAVGDVLRKKFKTNSWWTS